MTENESRQIVRDYLNGTYTEQELANKFDLEKCNCGNYELEEDMTYHRWDLANREEKICESCRCDE